MRAWHLMATTIAWTAFASGASAAEPNQTFAARTMLAPGVLSVMDEISPGVIGEPDTFLGVRNVLGAVYEVDDNNSPLGNGFASGLGNVPTNAGGINFSITGYPDENFEGSHGEQGGYEVFVDVYDFFGDLLDRFSERRVLAAGAVHNFTYSDFAWNGGTYDVYIDNQLGAAGDIDFFTFTGLTPGAQFTAETFDPMLSGVDTLLGWFDSTGGLLDADDDGAGGLLSQIEGVVPSGGMVTFAVTGFGDESFMGFHEKAGTYELRLSLGASLAGDFNDDNQVNAQDLTVWRQNFGPANATADADADGDSDGSDFLIWQRNLGASQFTDSNISAAPEPASATLVALAAAATAAWRRRQVAPAAR